MKSFPHTDPGEEREGRGARGGKEEEERHPRRGRKGKGEVAWVLCLEPTQPSHSWTSSFDTPASSSVETQRDSFTRKPN